MVRIEPIDKQNFRTCLKLQVKPEQARFVGTNASSLALAYVYDNQHPHAIYSGDQMVGFVMYAIDGDTKQPYINRLMIDGQFQRKGYGKAVIQLLIKKFKQDGCAVLDVIHKPDNEDAINLYNKLGFHLIDEKVGTDVVSRLDLITKN